jgi:hypothetical protein
VRNDGEHLCGPTLPQLFAVGPSKRTVGLTTSVLVARCQASYRSICCSSARQVAVLESVVFGRRMPTRRGASACSGCPKRGTDRGINPAIARQFTPRGRKSSAQAASTMVRSRSLVSRYENAENSRTAISRRRRQSPTSSNRAEWQSGAWKEGAPNDTDVNTPTARSSGLARYLEAIDVAETVAQRVANGNSPRVATVTTADNGTLARVGKVMSEKLVFVYTTKIAAKTAKLL